MPARALRADGRPRAASGRAGTVRFRLRDFSALERNIIILLAALLILGMGQELWSGFAPKYLEALRASGLVIAVPVAR